MDSKATEYNEVSAWCAERGYKPCGLNAEYCIPAWDLANGLILFDNEDGRFFITEDNRADGREVSVLAIGPWAVIRDRIAGNSYTIGRMEADGKWYFISTTDIGYALHVYNKWAAIYPGVSGYPFPDDVEAID